MSSVSTASALVIAAWMLLLWGWSTLRRNVNVVDVGWGLGFVLVAWTATAWAASETMPDRPTAWLLPTLVTLWGLRLAAHLAWRSHGQPEDKRYAAMRTARGESFWWRSLYIVFGLQGVVMWIVSLPIQRGIADAVPGWTALHAVGIAVWSVGLLFETVGDWQLARFRARPENVGRVCDRGLWRYTRHPNYFGDCCVWWGLFLVAIAQGAAWWTVVSPVLMTVLLLRFSGVTLLEQTLTREKPGYCEYIARTSAFVPWLPKRPAS